MTDAQFQRLLASVEEDLRILRARLRDMDQSDPGMPWLLGQIEMMEGEITTAKVTSALLEEV